LIPQSGPGTGAFAPSSLHNPGKHHVFFPPF
jgi:hypothetical protein